MKIHDVLSILMCKIRYDRYAKKNNIILLHTELLNMLLLNYKQSHAMFGSLKE